LQALTGFVQKLVGRQHKVPPLGRHFPEFYSTLILRRMLTDRAIGYVDLRSPAGIGLGALVYNYDGRVFASDEGRMLAEMGTTLSNSAASILPRIVLSFYPTRRITWTVLRILQFGQLRRNDTIVLPHGC
jgi:hypothetical protein